jgi:hypothetical protein
MHDWFDKNHFVRVDLDTFLYSQKEITEFPQVFDYIYWNIWDSCQLTDEKEWNWIDRLWDKIKPGGRFILGFYDSAENNRSRVNKLKIRGYPVNEITNPFQKPHLVVWLSSKLLQ